MSEPAPPADEPWNVWHRASSEQVASALQRAAFPEEAMAILDRAQDFANRALRDAKPLEVIFTRALIKGIDDVRFALRHPELLEGS